jgi:hypothetical protein
MEYYRNFQIAGTLLILLFMLGCRKEEKNNFKFSGIYLIDRIEQTVSNAEDEEDIEYENPGFLYLRFDGFNLSPQNPGVLNVADEVESELFCLEELQGDIEFGWIVEEEQLVWLRAYNGAGSLVNQYCYFDILRNKKFRKKIRYTSTRVTPDDELIEVSETFFLTLKKD